MSPKKLPFFYGWVIVFLSCLQVFAVVGCGNNCWSVFTISMCEDLSITRQQFSAYFTVVSITQIFALMTIDKVFARLGQLNTMKITAITGPLALLGISRVHSVWGFYAFGIVLGYGFIASSFYSVAIILSKWFIDKRGSATGMVFMSSPLGSMILVPLATGWDQTMGWRTAVTILAGIMAAITIPLAYFLLKERPEDIGLEPYVEERSQIGEKPVDPDSLWGYTRGEAIRLLSTWLFIAAIVGNYMAGACSNALVPYLQDTGFSARAAGWVHSIGLGAIAFARYAGGRLSDRFGCVRVLRVTYALTPLLLVGLVLVPKTTLVVPVMILGYASSQVLGAVLLPLITGRLYGRKHYTSMYGLFNAFGVAMGASIPLALGTVYTTFGSYLPAFKVILAVTIISFFIANLFATLQMKNREKKIHEQAPQMAEKLLNAKV